MARVRSAPFALLAAALACAALRADEPAPALEPLLVELLQAPVERRLSLIDAHAAELGSAQIDALLQDGGRQRARNELGGALSAFELARDLADRLALPRDAGRARRSLAQILIAFGRHAEARAALRRARELFAGVGDAEMEARTIVNEGIVARQAGEPDEALAAYAQASARAEALGNAYLAAVALNNSAVVHLARGALRPALEALDQALEQSRAAGDQQLTADVYANLGLLYSLQGNYSLSVDYLQRSLALQRELGNTFGSINEHANLGHVLLSLERKEEARAAFAASAALADESGAKDLAARAHSGLGVALVALGRLQEASSEATRALELARESNTPEAVAQALIFGSELDVRLGSPVTALAKAREAALLADATGSRLVPRARQAEGGALEALGRSEEAQAAYERSIAAIEAGRDAVAGGEIERESFMEARVAPYERLLALVAARGQAEPALAQAERAKARVLVDALQSGRATLVAALDPAERERERELREALAHANAASERERSEAARERQKAARRAYEGLRASLYAAHPELRERRGLLPPFESARARALLDAETLVLEYAVTDQHTYLFTLAREGPARLHVLSSGRRALQDATRSFREQLAARDLGVRTQARSLCAQLLGPALQQVGRHRRLLIVPDGPLWELPFQALECEPGRYLLERHALAVAPSLTALGAMSQRAATAHSAGRLLAFGNPDVGDVARRRTAALYRDAQLGPLPGAEAEVKALGKLYGPTSAVYVGAQAREQRLKAEAPGRSVIHVAAHGILDDQSPMYSHLALANPRPGDTDDGRLEAWELMDLNLDADLAVLSACESGRGRVRRGEGLIGLSWAFFVAGCPTTVVSQWKVDSDSTSKLMLEFHRRLAAGTPKAEALQAAAARLRKDPRYSHPFYWAPFVVVGAGLGAPATPFAPAPRARP